mgnify:CR=1 FL=1
MVLEATMEAPIKAPLIETDYMENNLNSLFNLLVNMMSDYIKGDESTIVLPIVCSDSTVLAVLDGGAGISIVTKQCWEEIGRPHWKLLTSS